MIVGSIIDGRRLLPDSLLYEEPEEAAAAAPTNPHLLFCSVIEGLEAEGRERSARMKRWERRRGVPPPPQVEESGSIMESQTIAVDASPQSRAV